MSSSSNGHSSIKNGVEGEVMSSRPLVHVSRIKKIIRMTGYMLILIFLG